MRVIVESLAQRSSTMVRVSPGHTSSPTAPTAAFRRSSSRLSTTGRSSDHARFRVDTGLVDESLPLSFELAEVSVRMRRQAEVRL